MKAHKITYKDTVLINFPDVVKVGEVELLLRRNDTEAKKRLVHVIYHRLNNRYVRPLRKIPDKKRSGFLTMAAACLVIEAFQSFRGGYEYTRKKGAGEKCFAKFFTDNEAFCSLRPFSSDFYSNIRCGIFHQAETYGNWLIWHKKGSPLFFLDKKAINADVFLEELAKIIQQYRSELETADWNNKLWVRAKRKLTTICQHCKPVVLHLNLHGEFFAMIATGKKRTEFRDQTPYWKKRLEHRKNGVFQFRKYDLIQFRNGYATDAPEMQVQFRGIRHTTKDGKILYAVRLGKILKIKRWKGCK
jgi:hypothetical protein